MKLAALHLKPFKAGGFVRISPEQYRALAELTRQSCCSLELTSSAEMDGNWGDINFAADDVFGNASSPEPCGASACIIRVAIDIQGDRFRQTRRPEISWAGITDDEAHAFVVLHEIGHRVDNFRFWSIPRELDPDNKLPFDPATGWINEVLADRFAWSVLRPGQPLPLNENGRDKAGLIADLIKHYDSFVPRGIVPRPHPPGQYSYVSYRMLADPILAAYVGPDCDPGKIRKATELVVRNRTRRSFPLPVPLFEADAQAAALLGSPFGPRIVHPPAGYFGFQPGEDTPLISEARS